jgi:hypothetical protein
MQTGTVWRGSCSLLGRKSDRPAALAGLFLTGSVSFSPPSVRASGSNLDSQGCKPCGSQTLRSTGTVMSCFPQDKNQLRCRFSSCPSAFIHPSFSTFLLQSSKLSFQKGSAPVHYQASENIAMSMGRTFFYSLLALSPSAFREAWSMTAITRKLCIPPAL